MCKELRPFSDRGWQGEGLAGGGFGRGRAHSGEEEWWAASGAVGGRGAASPWRPYMKLAGLVLCVACASVTWGQNVVGNSTGQSAISSEPQPIVMMTHPQHASAKPMASEQSLLGSSTYTYAQGERPLWEVAPVKKVTPLGDAARDLRKEHLGAKKASKVFEN